MIHHILEGVGFAAIVIATWVFVATYLTKGMLEKKKHEIRKHYVAAAQLAFLEGYRLASESENVFEMVKKACEREGISSLFNEEDTDEYARQSSRFWSEEYAEIFEKKAKAFFPLDDIDK